MTGTLRKSEVPTAPAFSTEQVRARCKQTLPAADVYDRLMSLGSNMDRAFAGSVSCISVRMRRSLGFGYRTDWPIRNTSSIRRFWTHVCTLIRLSSTVPGKSTAVTVVRTCQSRWKGSAAIRTVSTKRGCTPVCEAVEKGDTQVVDIRVYDEAERPVADLDRLAVRLLPFAKLHSSQASTDDVFYRVASRRATGTRSEPRSIEAWQARSCSPMRKVSAWRWPTG